MKDNQKKSTVYFSGKQSNEMFQAIYDSPASLPGKYKWVTKDEEVCQIEKI